MMKTEVQPDYEQVPKIPPSTNIKQDAFCQEDPIQSGFQYFVDLVGLFENHCVESSRGSVVSLTWWLHDFPIYVICRKLKMYQRHRLKKENVFLGCKSRRGIGMKYIYNGFHSVKCSCPLHSQPAWKARAKGQQRPLFQSAFGDILFLRGVHR